MNKEAIKTKEGLRREINYLAGKIKVRPKQIRIQKMKRKWASCSTSGWVSFNVDLLMKSRNFQEQVIIHELLHLVIPNHGRLFRTMMNIHLPFTPPHHTPLT